VRSTCRPIHSDGEEVTSDGKRHCTVSHAHGAQKLNVTSMMLGISFERCGLVNVTVFFQTVGNF